MGGVSILAQDKAELAIAGKGDTFNLYVRKGHVEFIFSPKTKKVDFYTPDGVYSAADLMFNASTSPVVRGYMQVDDAGTRVGVREGRMVFNTANGAKTVKAKEYIVLAMADVDKKSAKKGAAAPLPASSGQQSLAAEKTFMGLPVKGLAWGAVAMGTAVGVGLAVSNNNGGGGGGGGTPNPSPNQ